jgi:RES domain-containing protein
VTLYRIALRAFASTTAEAFSGEGGLHGSGRWHHRGGLIIYTSAHVSLALLEVLAHLDQNHLPEYVLWTIEVPDANILVAANLPETWRINLNATRDYGAAWLGTMASVAMRVPSVIVPAEHNVLINPAHPEFNLGWVRGPGERLRIDPRITRHRGPR